MEKIYQKKHKGYGWLGERPYFRGNRSAHRKGWKPRLEGEHKKEGRQTSRNGKKSYVLRKANCSSKKVKKKKET